jgi:hypothetical protein
MSSLKDKDLSQHHKALKTYWIVALLAATIDLYFTTSFSSLVTTGKHLQAARAARGPQKPAQHKQHTQHTQQVDNNNNIVTKYIDVSCSSVGV